MMDRHDDDGGMMAELDPSPDFAQRVMGRVAELEGIRELAQEQDRNAWRLLLSCAGGACALAWLVTLPLLPFAGALLQTAYYLLDESAAASAHLTPAALLIGLLLGAAVGVIGAAKVGKGAARGQGAA